MKKPIEKQGNDIPIVRRTGNIFAQLNRPNADELLRRTRVINVINEVLKERGLDQADAAKLLEIDQADVSRLMHGQVSRFSLDRLMSLVERLGVGITLTQSHDENNRLVVEVLRAQYA